LTSPLVCGRSCFNSADHTCVNETLVSNSNSSAGNATSTNSTHPILRNEGLRRAMDLMLDQNATASMAREAGQICDTELLVEMMKKMNRFGEREKSCSMKESNQTMMSKMELPRLLGKPYYMFGQCPANQDLCVNFDFNRMCHRNSDRLPLRTWLQSIRPQCFSSANSVCVNNMKLCPKSTPYQCGDQCYDSKQNSCFSKLMLCPISSPLSCGKLCYSGATSRCIGGRLQPHQ